jgi:PHD/YefM family antitoxin component YafN of YafNO toxin-antitoxin module
MEFAANHLSELCDHVADGDRVVILEREGHAPVALVSAAELRSLAETAHVLGDRTNAQRLFDAMEGLERGECIEMTLDQLGAWARERGLTEERDSCNER